MLRHFCGSHALVHALEVEQMYELRDDTVKAIDVLENAFYALSITNKKQDRIDAINIKRTAEYLELPHIFLKFSLTPLNNVLKLLKNLHQENKDYAVDVHVIKIYDAMLTATMNADPTIVPQLKQLKIIQAAIKKTIKEEKIISLQKSKGANDFFDRAQRLIREVHAKKRTTQVHL